MPSAQVSVMPDATLSAWREHCASVGTPLPDAEPGDGWEAVAVHVDDVEVGGAVLTYAEGGGRRSCSIRVLQTTVADGDTDVWVAVVGALEQHARDRGARSLVTAAPPRMAAALQAAGFGATMAGMAVRVDGAERVLADDGHVTVRPMTTGERRRFAVEASTLMREGMTATGVLSGPGAPMDELDRRLLELADDPAPAEVLLTAEVDGEPAGSFWATLAEDDEGRLLLGNHLDLDDRFRGRGLTTDFLAAVETWAREHGVHTVTGQLYGRDRRARESVITMGGRYDLVHLRKDLDPDRRG